MSKRKTANKIDGVFVALLIEVIDSLAWRAMSHGAKVLYIALRRRYNHTTDNNGKIYLPQRTAQKELNSKRDQIVRWFRELQHFGFIVMTSAGHLGVHGYGRAPRWRLTELPCKGEPPTKDFHAWSGTPFTNQKTESRSRKGDHCGPENGTKETGRENGARVSLGPEKGTKTLGPEKGTKFRFAIHPLRSGERGGGSEDADVRSGSKGQNCGPSRATCSILPRRTR